VGNLVATVLPSGGLSEHRGFPSRVSSSLVALAMVLRRLFLEAIDLLHQYEDYGNGDNKFK
jgi:hypothetical protein